MTVQENHRRPLASDTSRMQVGELSFSRVFMNERRFRLRRQRKLERNLAFTSVNKRLRAFVDFLLDNKSNLWCRKQIVIAPRRHSSKLIASDLESCGKCSRSCQHRKSIKNNEGTLCRRVCFAKCLSEDSLLVQVGFLPSTRPWARKTRCPRG